MKKDSVIENFVKSAIAEGKVAFYVKGNKKLQIVDTEKFLEPDVVKYVLENKVEDCEGRKVDVKKIKDKESFIKELVKQIKGTDNKRGDGYVTIGKPFCEEPRKIYLGLFFEPDVLDYVFRKEKKYKLVNLKVTDELKYFLEFCDKNGLKYATVFQNLLKEFKKHPEKYVLAK
jgi:hypothetical protein